MESPLIFAASGPPPARKSKERNGMNGSTPMQGGRLRKTNRGIISFAPFLAGTSALALGAVLATTSPSGAGMCTSANNDGVYVCSDAAAAGSDSTAFLRQQTTGGSLNVTSSADFGITTASGNAIDIDHGSNIGAGSVTAGPLDVRLTGSGTITANNGYGVHVVSRFRGDAYIDIQQNIDAAHQGFDMVALGPVEDVTIKLRDVLSGVDRPGNTARVNDGVQVEQHGRDLTFEVGAVTSEARAIHIWHASGARAEGHGRINVTVNGAITSGTNNLSQRQGGLVIAASASVSTTDVTTTADATITTSNGGNGIHLYTPGNAGHRGIGDITLTVGGAITASGKGIVIDQRTVDHRVVDSSVFPNVVLVDEPVYVNTRVTTTATVAGTQDAIEISHMGRGKVYINAQAGLTSTNNEAIDITTGESSGGVEITTGISADGATANVGEIQSGKDGISVNHQGVGDVDIMVGDDITTTGTAANCSTDAANCERGIDVATAASGGALTVEVTGSTEINSHDSGIQMRPDGSGPVSLTVGEDASILAANEAGVYVYTGTAAESVTINMHGSIGSATSTNTATGMYVVNRGSGPLNIRITGDVRGSRGIVLGSAGDADVYINSLVKADSGQGIVLSNDDTAGADRFTIRLGPDAVIEASTLAMELGNAKSGSETVVHLAGAVTGGSGAAIGFGGAANERLVINTGVDYTITGTVSAGGGGGDAVIELAGGGEDSFNLDDDLGKFTDFDILEKTGSGTWTLTNSQGRAKTFTRIDVNEGKLVSEGLTELIGTNLNIAEGAAFGVTQEGTTLFNTAVTLSGTIELANANTTLSIYQNAVTGRGGGVVIPVDFSAMEFEDGEHDFSVPRFSAGSVSGDPVVVNINASGELPEDLEGGLRIGNLVAVDTANPNAFTPGTVRGGRLQLAFETTDEGEWTAVFTQGGPGSIEQALYESLPAVLTQLASLRSYQQRLQGRRHDGGVWGKVSGVSAAFEPVATSLATYEVKDSVAEFGVDVPLHAEHAGNFTVGANVAFGDAAAEVAVPDSTGEIKTGSFKAAISANWEFGGPYVDGQLQYAVFNNDVKTDDAKLGSTNVTAYSGGLEVGYGMDLGNLRVAPSVRLLWASVDFEDFTNSAGTEIVLDDGVVVTGRAGVGVEYDWNGALFEGISSADVVLRGRAGVLIPFDGDVNTRIGGTEFISSREESAFDAGLGATYVWDGYALSADVSTRQGEEVEGYAGSVGFKYKF